MARANLWLMCEAERHVLQEMAELDRLNLMRFYSLAGSIFMQSALSCALVVPKAERLERTPRAQLSQRYGRRVFSATMERVRALAELRGLAHVLPLDQIARQLERQTGLAIAVNAS